MKILVSNDDGYLAPGIQTLVNQLKTIATVVVVAPDQNRSGSSSSLTLNKPLKVKKIDDTFYCVNGTPTDCVHIALTGLLNYKPDMIISGINDGANMGDDTIYSGTVAAAMEGYLLNIPSFAISMAKSEPKNFNTAALVTLKLIKAYEKVNSNDGILLNINVPDVPFDEIKGYAVTRLGKRHEAKPVIKKTGSNGEINYWVGAAGQPCDNGPGTDFNATEKGLVSISPIQADLTDHANIESVKKWIKK